MTKKGITIILLGCALLGAGVFAIYQSQVFSKEILKLEILGPDKAKSGEEIEYTVRYKNNGDFVLENPKLTFEIPENSLTEDGKNRIVRNLDDIYPGGENFIKLKTRLLGNENDLKVARATLSYEPKNLNARYESETSFTTKLESISVTLDFDLPSKAEKGKEIEYSVNYFSNIDYPLENLSIKVDPSLGFNFQSSNPASLDKSEWKLPVLNLAQGGRIKIKGIVTADSGQQIDFSAKLGMWKNGEFILIKETKKQVDVIAPLLYISQSINGSSNYVAFPGDTLRYRIFFRNLGSTPFENLFITANLDSPALDMGSLRSDSGDVRPADRLIVWDWKQVPSLKELDSQQEGEINFEVKLKDSWTGSSDSLSIVKNTVSISQISQEFQTKISSKLEISSKGFYNNQIIQNSGPLPPIAGKPTTYTIIWQAKNYFNNLKNVKVRATLPEGVILTGKIFPESESQKLSLDSASREIVWSLGDMAPRTGISGAAPSVSFQISFTPSPLQRGRVAGLLSEATISGEDQFTGVFVSAKALVVTTDIPDDISASGKGIVQ